MKSVTINHYFRTEAHSRAKMNSLMHLMTNDNYLFIDSSMKVVEYSHSAVDLFARVLKTKIKTSVFFFEQIVTDKESAQSIALFLTHNIQNEMIVVRLSLNDIFIHLHISKVYDLEKHIGYNCLIKESTASDLKYLEPDIKYHNDFSASVKDAIRIGPLVIKRGESPLSGDQSELYTRLKNEYQLFHQHAEAMLSILRELSNSLNTPASISSIEPRFTDIRIKNILVLDEDKLIHVFIKTIMKSIAPEINILSFISIEEASEFIHTHPTDLIILDPEMSTSSGWDFLEVLNRLALNTPVLLSPPSNDNASIKRISQHNQVKGIVNKPITKESFLNILNF